MRSVRASSLEEGKKSNFCKEKRDDKVTSLTRNCSLPMWPFGFSKRTNLVCQGVALRKPRLLSVTHNWTRWSGETAIRIHEEFTPFAHEQKGFPRTPPQRRLNCLRVDNSLKSKSVLNGIEWFFRLYWENRITQTRKKSSQLKTFKA